MMKHRRVDETRVDFWDKTINGCKDLAVAVYYPAGYRLRLHVPLDEVTVGQLAYLIKTLLELSAEK